MDVEVQGGLEDGLEDEDMANEIQGDASMKEVCQVKIKKHINIGPLIALIPSLTSSLPCAMSRSLGFWNLCLSNKN